MGILGSLSPPKPIFSQQPKHGLQFNLGPPSKLYIFGAKISKRTAKRPISTRSQQSSEGTAILIGAAAGITLVAIVGPTHAAELPIFSEPSNALSLPTWAVHVSSVVEWATAMALVWQYGEKSGYESWKGLSWGMVPLLGGALCACTWHFFYNSESLEVLVALQAALTVIGNVTMCIAAYRIYVSSQERSNNS
ncbi:ycf49-like protein [Phtheirospermum japonicum]|uniref:Ycf49-like protein n=1 Tax=Phtheirospermum japonicum TaxID=374723 RepID=A0A830BWH2_9LAMI|nr:ycf49-like protein [Phtheirospermum japonicum]